MNCPFAMGFLAKPKKGKAVTVEKPVADRRLSTTIAHGIACAF
jgi:hypothetical protein